jgi:hypothetical protein
MRSSLRSILGILLRMARGRDMKVMLEREEFWVSVAKEKPGPDDITVEMSEQEWNSYQVMMIQFKRWGELLSFYQSRQEKERGIE